MPASELETEEWTRHLDVPLQLSAEGEVANNKEVELCLIGFGTSHREMLFFDSLHVFFSMCFDCFLLYVL